MKPELLEKLNWLAAKHITREYRTTTINEDDAKQILAALKPSDQPIAWWNGFRKSDPDGGTYPSFAESEDTNHDIPVFAGVNPCNYTSPRVVDEAMVATFCNVYEELEGGAMLYQDAVIKALQAALEAK